MWRKLCYLLSGFKNYRFIKNFTKHINYCFLGLKVYKKIYFCFIRLFKFILSLNKKVETPVFFMVMFIKRSNKKKSLL